MARTYKDAPQRVIEARNLEAGRVRHDHTPPSNFERPFYFSDRELSRTFYKDEQKAIRAHRALLDDLSTAVVYTEEEVPNHKSGGVFSPEGYYTPVSYRPKLVKFTVHRVRSYRETAYCTDAEHYDEATGTDVRDGGRVKCVPSPEDPARPGSRGYRCSCCTYPKARASRSSVKQALGELVHLANAGELEEDYSSALVEEPYGPKKWG